MGNQSTAADDHAPDRQTRFRIDLEWRITHFLLHLKASRLSFRIFRDGFVNVRCHEMQTAQGSTLFQIHCHVT